MVHVVVITVVELDVFDSECGLLNDDLDLVLIKFIAAATLAARGLKIIDRDSQALTGCAGRAGRTKQHASEATPPTFQQLFVAVLRQPSGQSPDHTTGLVRQVGALIFGSHQFHLCDRWFWRDGGIGHR